MELSPGFGLFWGLLSGIKFEAVSNFRVQERVLIEDQR